MLIQEQKSPSAWDHKSWSSCTKDKDILCCARTRLASAARNIISHCSPRAARQHPQAREAHMHAVQRDRAPAPGT